MQVMKLIRFLLFPFTIVYILITSIRNFLYDIGFLKATSFNKPIIAVGNLSVGGTGKTPQIEYLIQLLNGRSLAVLSRGYGRNTKGFLCADATKTAADIGDEPLQFYKKFPDITVAVDENRVHGIQKVHKSSIVLLDDAFQHRKVKAGFYVVLTKYNDLFSNDFVLPTGNLRERRSGVQRANAVIITKCPRSISMVEQNDIKKLVSRYFKGPIFFSSINYSTELFGAREQRISASELRNYEVVLITGIANPAPLLAHLSDLDCKYTHVSFSDHHQFSENEVQGLQAQFDALQGSQKMILTTEKDYVRLENRLTNLYYLPIATTFVDRQNEFDNLILNYVNADL